MRVDEIALEDFRNYVREEATLAPGLNLIVGENAQGKTNLLEAVHYFSGFGSPRAQDPALVRDGAERALLHAQVARGERRVRIDIEIKPGRGARALLNRAPMQSLRTLHEVVVSVFFGPDELSLIKGSPEGRRRFLDDLVVKLRPVRESLRREFERVLKQRNALLRSAPRRGGASSVESTLSVWDEQLAGAGAALAAARLEALAALLPYARKRFEAIAGTGRIEFAYASDWLTEDISSELLLAPGSADEPTLRAALAASIAQLRNRELERGVTLVGPQRDDVRVLTAVHGDGRPLDARSYASQGDQRTAALALKLAEHDLLTEALGDPPILLLDDVFSELDPARRGWLVDAVTGPAQTIITTADIDRITMLDGGAVLHVARGKISRGGRGTDG